MSEIKEKKTSLKDLHELLRKRPKLEDFEIEHMVDENGTHPIDAGCYETQMEKWFELFTGAFNEFEKKLRDWQENLKDLPNNHVARVILKEILGDECE